MPSHSVEAALPARRASRAVFERAGPTFDDARVMHDWARGHLLGRLPFVRVDPRVIVDLGCATGAGAAALAARFEGTPVLAVDTSHSMLVSARRGDGARTPHVLVGDAERLPLPSGSVSLILANLVLPWCRPERMFAEAARVLAPGGLLLFATFGPDTLQEVRRAWARVDDCVHVHAAFEMHDLGDLAVAAGLQEPVMDVERITVTYAHVRDLVRDLRACGGINAAAGRRGTLTGRRRWDAFADALHAGRQTDRFGVTVELIFGQAWGGSPAAAPRAAGEIVVALSSIGRRDR